MTGAPEPDRPFVPALSSCSLATLPVRMSLTSTSLLLLEVLPNAVHPPAKATKRPSAEIDGYAQDVGAPIAPTRDTWVSGSSATLPTSQSSPPPVCTTSAPPSPQTWLPTIEVASAV